jgi:hypothetical protein
MLVSAAARSAPPCLTFVASANPENPSCSRVSIMTDHFPHAFVKNSRSHIMASCRMRPNVSGLFAHRRCAYTSSDRWLRPPKPSFNNPDLSEKNY